MDSGEGLGIVCRYSEIVCIRFFQIDHLFHNTAIIINVILFNHKEGLVYIKES